MTRELTVIIPEEYAYSLKGENRHIHLYQVETIVFHDMVGRFKTVPNRAPQMSHVTFIQLSNSSATVSARVTQAPLTNFGFLVLRLQ